MAPTSPGPSVVTALQDLYDAIRARHPDVPAAMLITGSAGRGRDRVNGHYAASRWVLDAKKGTRVGELLIAGERIREGAHAVLETMLHEAAHALGDARGIRTTSRGGRYHNVRFAELAAELGLVCQTGPHGFAHTDLDKPMTPRAYQTELTTLRKALKAWRDPEAEPVSKPKSNNLLRAECPCGRVIRASRACLEEAPVMCAACEQPFYTDPFAGDAD